jgi:hypothetical protein
MLPTNLLPNLTQKFFKGSEPVQLEEHVFCIFIDYRGHYRKGVAI